MKRTNKIMESAIGFVPMLLLWVIGSLSYNNFYVELTAGRNEQHIGAVIPMVVIAIMPVWLQVFAIVGKVFNLKLMYIFAVIGMGLPTFGYILTNFTVDDGNILHWIYVFTIGIVLLPFAKLAFPALEGAAIFSYLYTNRFWDCYDIYMNRIDSFATDVCRIYLLAIVISVILFLLVKTKKDVFTNL